MNESRTCEKNVAAFFDLDGTVLAPPSLEVRFVAHLARGGKLRPSAITKWLAVFLYEALKNLTAPVHFPIRLATLDRNKAHLAGVNQRAAADWAEQHLARVEFFPQALKQIALHRQRGHTIFFLSGTLAPLAQVAASHLAPTLGEIHVAATELESVGDIWTGRIAGEAICGPAKARAMSQLAERFHIDLTQSYAYANSSTDRWMLAAAGHPLAVNPGVALAQLAREYGWPILRWNVDDPISLHRSNFDLTNGPLIPRRGIHGNNSI
ncbi:MAG TPA: HAD-IB family hydrolase [Candidatus Acidoferrales bacterium]|nr:HAD-IB family hydrolase [Candidatus Acidoferrales bacterium]